LAHWTWSTAESRPCNRTRFETAVLDEVGHRCSGSSERGRSQYHRSDGKILEVHLKKAPGNHDPATINACSHTLKDDVDPVECNDRAKSFNHSISRS
jgi:hypothetical protein